MTVQPDGAVEWGSLYYGDCLEVMRRWKGGQADLIYLDPPFNSNQDYNILYGTIPEGGRTAQRTAFTDTWTWDDAAADRSVRLEELGLVHSGMRNLARSLKTLLGESGMLAYLTYMAERLAECKRVLKDTGSVYLHCDDTAAHYLKAVMDSIFGTGNYLNDITWRRATSHNDARKFGRICDRILFYAKDASKRYWNGDDPEAGIGKTPEMIAGSYPSDDNDGEGRYRVADLTGAGVRGGESGTPWNGYEVTSRGRHWAVPLTSHYAEWIEEKRIPGYRSIKGAHARLDALDEAGLIHHPRKAGGWPGLKRYAAADSGRVPPQNLILDPIGWTNFNKDDEYLGYDTQKPVGLLRPLIAAACPPQGTVLDPFAGCGTTVDAAHRLGRRWAGIDIGVEALRVTLKQRLLPQGLGNVKIHGIPVELESARHLAEDDPFGFEKWIVQCLPGLHPNAKQTGDSGIDGRGEVHADGSLVVAQVFAGRNAPSASKIRDFCRVIDREKAAVGIFLTLDYKPTQAAKAEARALGEYRLEGAASGVPRLQFFSAKDLFEGNSPTLPTMRNPHTGKAMDFNLFEELTIPGV